VGSIPITRFLVGKGEALMKGMKIRVVAVMACLMIGNSYAAAVVNDSATSVKWSYKGVTGPSHWASLDPAFNLCAVGKRQAPIDILTKKTPLSQLTFAVQYQPISVREIDNGTTQVQIGHDYFIIADGHSVQLNVPADQQARETLTINGRLYRLLQFHFHTPSETMLNKESLPAEIHFVHQGLDGTLAVVAVFVKVGAANHILQTILDKVPKEEGKEVSVDEPLDISQLIAVKKGAYYFAGSLTTPPCTEGVAWLVLADTITASSEQIAKLRKAANGANARPVQPLNNRPVITIVAGDGKGA
jgi:carbonic anhydrase